MAFADPTPFLPHKTISAKGRTLVIRDVAPHEVDQILALQELIHHQMTDPEIYADTDRGQFEESLRSDYVWGAYDGDILTAVATLIRNRDSQRNLGKKCGEHPASCFTLDAIFVHPAYRGMGLQAAFIMLAKAQAKADGGVSVWATVSPKNAHSYKNLEKEGFYPFQQGVVMYGKHLRDIMICNL